MTDDERDHERDQAGLGALTGEVRGNWHRFLDVFEPVRPELYRYCRYLAESPWDAEDLVQETLIRAFVTLGTMFAEVPEPRAWLFRVASNLWVDRARRARLDQKARALAGAPPVVATDPQDLRETAGTLFELAPQERAAVVLKDVFGFSLEEAAAALSTTPGAVKAALHRGRGKLASPEVSRPSGRAPAVVEAFCEAFNAHDLERLTSLLLDTASVEIVGVVTEYGRDAPKDRETGSLAGTLAPITYDERGGVPPELLEGYLGTTPRCEARPHRDGWVLLFWYDHEGGPQVRTVMTVEAIERSIVRVRNYFFTPDVIAEVCRELDVPHRVNGYRYWPRSRR